MTATYFLSDLHLDHQGITKFRSGFESTEHHNAVIKENYHKVVRPNDTVIFGGDVAFSPVAIQDLKSWSGTKHLVLGNHDHSEYKKRGVSLDMLREVFGDNIFGFYRKYGYWLSHCPIHSDELRGRMNVHGHLHSNLIDDPRYLNICMEHIDYTPISLEQIRAEFERRKPLIDSIEESEKYKHGIYY